MDNGDRSLLRGDGCFPKSEYVDAYQGQFEVSEYFIPVGGVAGERVNSEIKSPDMSRPCMVLL
jgi:hypothetical protein